MVLKTTERNTLKQALEERDYLLGPFIKLSAPAVAEIMGLAGFDFIIIDMEHGPMDIEAAQNMVRAAELVGTAPVIRVANLDSHSILRALDIGAHGVEIPHINSREAAERAVRWAKYSPSGERGICRYVRAAGYSSMDRHSYFAEANEKTTVIIHVEGIEGVDNIDHILSVDGLDVVFIGPYDLSQSLGVPGQVDHPLVIEKMEEIVRRSREAGKLVGTFVDDTAGAVRWIRSGVKYMSYAVDTGILYNAAAAAVRGVSETLSGNGEDKQR